MYRFRKGSGGMCRGRFCGMLLMLAGLIIMMLIVPRWAWAGIVCVVMVLAGFVLWKFC